MTVKHTQLRSIFSHLLLLTFAYSPIVATAEPVLENANTQLCAPDNKECPIHSAAATTEQIISAQVSNADNTPQILNWDWINKAQLPADQPCKLGCNGAYVAPNPDWPDADKSPENALVHGNADYSSMVNDIISLTGDVSISQGYRRINADAVTLNQNTNELIASGNIEFREPNLLIIADKIFIDTLSNLGNFESSYFLQHNNGIRGQAKTITRLSDSIMSLEEGTFTQCPPDDEFWLIKAGDINLDSDTGWGTAKQAILEIKGVPVFYTPHITFPINKRRKSGFLFPTYGSSGDNGFEVSAPYYLNLTTNADATISPRYISDRGLLTELEVRYLNPWGNWVVSGASLKEDDIFRGDEFTENNVDSDVDSDPVIVDEDFTKQDRWLATIEQTGQMGNVTTFIDYSKVSDNNYFRDLSITSLDIKRQTHLNQQIRLASTIGQWQATVIAQQHQTLDSDISTQYKLMPRTTIQYTDLADSFELEWIALAELTDFQHDESINNGGNFKTGDRLFIEAGASFPMLWAAGFIKPTVKLRTVHYDMDQEDLNNKDAYSVTTALTTIDMGLVFERELDIKGSRYTQTLEPRLFYFYSDYNDQNDHPVFDTSELTFTYNQLYRDSRFSGHDRLDDADQMSTGLTTRFIDNNNGRETLTASIGQIFYFDDREVSAYNTVNSLSNSFIATELQIQPIEKLWFSNTLLWDSRQDYLQEAGLSMQYQSNNTSLFNASYRYRRNGASDTGEGPRDLDQLDLSLALPLSDNWSVFSRFQYDIDEDRSVEDMFGIAYEDCCWMVRLVYQRAIENEVDRRVLGNTGELMGGVVVERDHVFVLQFQLKGLGGIGNKAASILEESILGYKENNE